MKVSIIIPVYNVEQYLPRCYDSVSQQTYQDIEIIFVDDGSKDNSGKLCDEYCASDKRAKVIHKKNGGLSSARNAGIEAATGDCIFFLDSDDYISTKCIEYMINILNDKKADIVIIRMLYVAEYFNKEVMLKDDSNMMIMNSEKAIEESLYQTRFTCSAPGKLYKRKIIGDLRFPDGRLSEDLATCHLFFDAANVIIYSDYSGYFYRQREHSIMHQFDRRRLDALVWSKDIEDYCKNKYQKIENAALCRTFNVAIHLALELPSSNNDEFRDSYNLIWNEIKRTRLHVIINNKARGRDRAAAIISFMGNTVLHLAWNSKLSVKQNKMQ